MKVLVIVALFAFVAVQVCQSAPVPEDVKVEKAEKPEGADKAVKEDAPAAAAENVSPAVVPTAPVAPASLAEVKSEPAAVDAAAKPADKAAPVPAEEKKE